MANHTCSVRIVLATLVGAIFFCTAVASAQDQNSTTKIGELIVQTIPTRHYAFGRFETDFQNMVEPIAKTLTALGDEAKEMSNISSLTIDRFCSGMGTSAVSSAI